MTTPGCLTGSPGRQGFRVTPMPTSRSNNCWLCPLLLSFSDAGPISVAPHARGRRPKSCRGRNRAGGTPTSPTITNYVEVQGFQRLYTALRITMPNEQINAEQQHRSDRIRTFIDDGVVDRSRLDVPRVVRWTERMIRGPKPLLTLLRW
jgi:hypothetical protein